VSDRWSVPPEQTIFDMLLVVRAEAIKATEERIIALLEQHTGYGDDEQDGYFLSAIALIEGDNK
jgi:hypothetical protein